MRIAALSLSLLVVLAQGACTPERERVTFEDFEAAIEASGVWRGGPPVRYEAVGRHSLAMAIEQGLSPQDTLLDIGAGSLRVGFWLLQYVDADNYYAIEPNREMIETAVGILDAPIHLFYNTDFVFPDERFDFVIARSIWSHASKPMIATMLSEFAAKARDQDARFIASYIPAETPEQDYQGTEWVGKDHGGGRKGYVQHSLDWIVAEGAKHGLWVKPVPSDVAQAWVVIGPEPGA